VAKRKFSKREWTFILCGAAVILLTPVYFLGIRPTQIAYKQSAQRLESARDRLEHVMLWNDEVVEARRGQGAINDLIRSRSPRFDLWSHINEVCRKTGVKERAEVAKKGRSGLSSGNAEEVELTLTGVSMEELVNVLHEAGSGNSLVFVHELQHLVPAPDEKGLNCELTFVAPKA